MSDKSSKTVRFLLEKRDAALKVEADLYDRVERLKKEMEELRVKERELDRLIKERMQATSEVSRYNEMLLEQGIPEHEL